MSEFQRISTATAHQQWAADLATFVDIRDVQSFAGGHIPGAFHLTDASLNEFLHSLDDERPVVVVCYHGVSSQGAAQYLAQQGIEHVSSMDGGFTAWVHYYPDAVERN